MRLGTTSYIYPADMLTNVRKLADKVADVELVIFETDEHGDNYPDRDTVRELRQIARDHDLTFTIHLPLNLRLASNLPALDPARRVIAGTADLCPMAYVVHMDGETPGAQNEGQRLGHSLKSLDLLGRELGNMERICVENLESQSPELLNEILRNVPVSCCADVGHLWKQGRDPVPYLDVWLPRARVVHIHGVGTRDHKALSLMPAESLDPVTELLVDRFHGVLTFEVFNEPDLTDSLDAFRKSMARVCRDRCR